MKKYLSFILFSMFTGVAAFGNSALSQDFEYFLEKYENIISNPRVAEQSAFLENRELSQIHQAVLNASVELSPRVRQGLSPSNLYKLAEFASKKNLSISSTFKDFDAFVRSEPWLPYLTGDQRFELFSLLRESRLGTQPMDVLDQYIARDAKFRSLDIRQQVNIFTFFLKTTLDVPTVDNFEKTVADYQEMQNRLRVLFPRHEILELTGLADLLRLSSDLPVTTIEELQQLIHFYELSKEKVPRYSELAFSIARAAYLSHEKELFLFEMLDYIENSTPKVNILNSGKQLNEPAIINILDSMIRYAEVKPLEESLYGHLSAKGVHGRDSIKGKLSFSVEDIPSELKVEKMAGQLSVDRESKVDKLRPTPLLAPLSPVRRVK